MKKMHYLHRGWQNSSSGGPISLRGKTHFQRRLVLFPPIFYLRSLRIDWFQSFSEEFNYSKYTRKRNTSRANKKREMWDFMTLLPLLMIHQGKFQILVLYFCMLISMCVRTYVYAGITANGKLSWRLEERASRYTDEL